MTQKPSQNNTDSIAERLKYVIDTLGIKQSHLAEKLGLSPSGLHYILNNNIKSSKNIEKILTYLDSTENLIPPPTSAFYKQTPEDHLKKIPIFYPDQLKLYYHNKTKENLVTNDFIISTIPYTGNPVAVYMTELDFSPKFELNDIIVFETVENFTDGEILLVYLAQFNSITVKYGFHSDKDVIFMSPGKAPIKVHNHEKQITVIGEYRECYKRNTRT